MNNKYLTQTILALALLLVLVAPASAITASIGNSRMILRAAPGETLDKYVLVRNVNTVPVTINITVLGDLADTVKLKDNMFELQPGEEKKAYFTIKPKEEGTTTTKIGFAFIGEDGQSVGLASQVIVIASGDYQGSPDDDTQVDDVSQNSTIGNIFDRITGSDGSSTQEDGGKGISPAIILLISTLVLVVIFVILLVYSSKAKKRKKVGRSYA